jgi:hypothetical protein
MHARLRAWAVIVAAVVTLVVVLAMIGTSGFASADPCADVSGRHVSVGGCV